MFQNYVNYNITLPNDDIQFKVSGNYAVVVYPQNQRERPILYACFMVSEEAVKVNCSASSRTDKGFADNYQQVSFRIDRSDYNIVNPVNDLKIYVMQNNRLDNMAFVQSPQYFNKNEIVYEHNKDLIFDAEVIFCAINSFFSIYMAFLRTFLSNADALTALISTFLLFYKKRGGTYSHPW